MNAARAKRTIRKSREGWLVRAFSSEVGTVRVKKTRQNKNLELRF
jgi:hypothetical protein